MRKIFLMIASLAISAIAVASPSYANGGLVAGGTPDCKAVTVQRPNVVASPITVNFKNLKGSNDLLSQIEKCNDGAKSGFLQAKSSQTGGVLVIFTASVGEMGSGKILLPISLTDGSADMIVCYRPKTTDGYPTHQKYATDWSNALPDTITMQALDNYDREAADQNCREILHKTAGK